MNPYDILNIPRTASQDDIKSAYRKLAKEYHPDINKSDDAVEKFKEISTAYELIKDKPVDDYTFDMRSSFNDNFSDIFRSFNMNYSIHLGISLEEAFNGTQREINLNGNNISLNIPAGVQNNSVIRLQAENSINLDVIIILNPHPVFQFRNSDLFYNYEVDFHNLICGKSNNKIIGIDNTEIYFDILPNSHVNPYIIIPDNGLKIYNNNSRGNLIINLSQNNRVYTMEEIDKIKSIRSD